MAGEVQLKLGVSLDLGYFRTEMQKAVNIVNSEFTGRLKVKFDRQILDRELNNLQRAIRRRTYRIEIGGNIDALPGKIKNLQQSLRELEGFGAGIGVTARAAVTKKDARKIRSDVYRQIVSEGGKILLPVGLAPVSQAAADRFKADLLKKIGSLTVRVKADVQGGFAASPLGATGLEQYMRTQGLSGGNMPNAVQVGRSERLRKALEDLTVKQLQALAKEEGIGGVSKLKKDPLIQKLVTDLQQETAERILGNIKNQLQNPLDIVARGIFRMLGIDPQSLREKRLPPAINWQATTPERTPPIGPSSTGRLLPGGTAASALPGTSFAQQKRLLGDLIDADLKEILRNAANTFVDSVRAEMNAAVRSVSVRDLGTTIKGAIAPGAPSPSRLMLPAAGGTGGYFGGGRRPGGGFVPEGGFPSDGPIAPSSPLARRLPPGYLEMGKFASQLREADKYLKQSKIPLAGAIEELGGEFAEATKQVLLYGTAYKALAFFTSLPQQAFDAAKALQTFNNQLNAITGSAQAAGRASAFVSSVVEQFNIPLDSARQGFTRLYASMEPAGISAQTIEGLFTGISKASATLGLSSDQVDRVTYAFSQMASKGQIMSEEVSGQLGDVIPGALSIMAQAAGMSMSDFKVAMEKGQLSGKALEQVFANLEIVLDQRFGKGAQGAANTLQGMVNAMQTAMTRLYESFEPIVGAVTSAFGPQITALISDGAAAVTAFAAAMQGSNGPANMLSENGKTIYGVIQQVAEILKATGSVIEGIAPTLAMLGKTILTIVEYIGKFINTPVGGFLADLALKAGLVLAAMQALSALMKLQLIASIIDFTRVTLASTTGLAGFTKATWTAVAATKAFRIALIGLGAGAVLLAIEALISKLSEAAGKMERLRKSTVDTISSIRQMDQAQARQVSNQTQSDLRAIENLEKNKRLGKDLVEITEDQYKALERAKVPGLTRAVTGRGRSGRFNVPAFDPTFAEAARQNLQRQQAEADKRLSDLQNEGSQQILQKIDLGAGKDAAKDGSKTAEKAAEDARRLADEKRKYEADLMKVNAAQAMALDNVAFENWKSLQDQRFDYLEAGQNEWMKREIKFQRDLQAIEIRRIEAIRQARQETQKAETGANAKAIVAQEKLPFKGGAVTSRRRDPDAERTGWDISMPGGMGAPVPAPIDLTITGTGFQGRGAGASGKGYGNWISGEFELGGKKYELLLGHFGQVNVSKGMQVPAGTVLGTQGITGRAFGPHVTTHVNPRGGATTQDAWSALETVTQRWEKGMTGGPASRARKEAKNDYQAQLAVVEALNQKEIEAARIKLANEEAQRAVNIAVREYVASIAPVEQQRLENSLLQDRINLLSSGTFGDALDTQQKIAEVEAKRTLGIQQAKAVIEENEALMKASDAAVKAGAKSQSQATSENQIYAASIASNTLKINELNRATKDYIPTLQEKLRLTQQSAEAELKGAIQRATPLGGLGLSAGFIGDAGSRFEEAIGRDASQQEAARFAELQNQLTLLETRNNAIKQSILGIGDAFATAMTTGVASLVDGTSSAKEVFSNFLKTVGQTLLQAAQQMIATYIAIGIAKIFAGLGGGGAGTSGLNINDALKYSSPIAGFANGGVAQGGFVPFKAFADGGVVNGPTLGLVGEGKYNEAIVPLPDGKSIPVMMKGNQPSSRELLSSNSSSIASSPVLNMSFESTVINGVEYVSRDQLEAAMMETRKLAARDGANRGAALAIDRLQHSPNTRRRIGMR